MANIKTWLTEATAENGETLEAIVVGQHDNARWETPINADENIVLPVEQALLKLDVDFNDGYGGADCFPIYAWTATRVYFIHEYDGSTVLTWAPRHPVDMAPRFSGQ